MRRGSWQLWAAVTAVVVAGYLLIPGAGVLDGWLVTGYKTLVGCLAGVALVTGAIRRRPPAMAAWLLFGFGITANALGALVSDVYTKGFGGGNYPNIADGFWLMLYPGLFFGVAVLIRARGTARDWASTVDAMTVATGLGLLSWVFLMVPVRSDNTLTTVGQVIVLAYPVGDLMVLAMLLHLVLSGGVRNSSFWLVCSSMALFLAGDGAWATLSQLGVALPETPTRLLDMLFLLAYALFAFAAWQPSVVALGRPGEIKPPRLTLLQLTLLTAATMIAPAILALQVSRHHVTNGMAIAIGSVALFLLVVTRMAQLVRQVERQARQLRELARSDALTGLPNRRAWFDELPGALARAARDGTPLTVAMLDLDHFKAFNDELGHQAGDRLLKGAASAWAAELRIVDMLARYGGEEFILLLPSAGADLATDVLARLRAATPAGQSFSAGLAVWDGTESAEELIERADRALYAAKANGRHRTECATDRVLSEPVRTEHLA
ncbi:GGDEF domain-containing protein [Actinoplanes sp. NPDC051343]|uniref:GGDEF domain-containing protein n=1 Tax=Actinoplanes sp. NPDC051343 TaxID=3363906 RepID=UPI00379163BD